MHALANFIFVSLLQLGAEGLGIAAVLGRFFGVSTSLAICVFQVKSGRFPWNGLRMNIFLGWKPMFKLGLFSALFSFIDISLFEISTFFSQFVSVATLSTVIMMIQIMTVSWSLVGAMSFSASNLIGKSLAEGSTSNVKQYIGLTLFNITLFLIPMVMFSYPLRNKLARFFTQDPEVIHLFTKNFWMALLVVALEVLQMSLNYGVLTAYGQQSFAALVSCVSYYLVGLPIIISSIFLTNFGLIGIMFGWVTADLILVLAATVKIVTSNIEVEIEKSRQRVLESCSKYGTFQSGTIDEAQGADLGESQQESDVKKVPDGTENVVNQEVKTVLGLFVVFGVLFISLASLSFLRD